MNDFDRLIKNSTAFSARWLLLLAGCTSIALGCEDDDQLLDPAGSAGASADTKSEGGTAGTAGAAETAGAAGVAGAAGAPPIEEPTSDGSVLQRNNHVSRDAHFVQPVLRHDSIAKLELDAAFDPRFEGRMYASPLYFADGPNGSGIFIAVTNTNDVHAFDEHTGATVWSKHLADSPFGNGLGEGCGDINPVGIESTPVIDPETRTLYVAGAVGGDVIESHQVYGLSLDDGSLRPGFPVEVTGTAADGTVFEAAPENQRGALALVNGILYVPYGGHGGDCGPYRGWVIAIDTRDPSRRGAWAALGPGAGIWAAGGLASDGEAVFGVTGNATVVPEDRSVTDSEQVVRLTGLAELDRSERNLFYPAIWRQMDAEDSDFGANNPIFLNVPRSTPSSFIAAIAKDGHFYLLNGSHLGGMDSQLATVRLGDAVHGSPAAYPSPRGMRFVSAVRVGGLCPPGGPSGKVISSVLIEPGSPPTVSVDWCATLSGQQPGLMATTTDGASESLVWMMDNGKLNALDGETGKRLFRSEETCEGVRKWTTPIAVKGRVVVSADGHLCSWSIPAEAE